KKFHLTGHSQFEQSQLSIDGEAQLQDDWPADIKFDFTDLDMDWLLRNYLKNRITGHSAIAGTLKLHGPLLRPSEMTVVGDFSDLYVDAQNIKIHNSGPARFSVANRYLSFDQFHLVGDGTDFTAAGKIQLEAPYALQLNTQGSANLRLIETFDHD